jgi:hypothetical protein
MTARHLARTLLAAPVLVGRVLVSCVLVGCVLVGCTDSHTGSDSGIVVMIDGGGSSFDGGGAPVDAGGGPVDSGGTTVTDGAVDLTDGAIPTRMGAVGAACASDADCTEPAGGVCQSVVGSGRFSYEFPGGYCSAMCTAGSGSSECGAGADCFAVGFGGFGFAFCAKVCRSDSDCRTAEGYTCQAPPIGGGSTRYCLPPRPGGGDGGFSIPDGGFSFGDGGFRIPDASIPPAP